jgi:hypothetical protein
MRTYAATVFASLLLLTQTAEAKIHRSSHARSEFKHMQPCPANGRTSGACPGYVIDHIKPLACGGPDEPGNMQWQTKENAKAKDRWERKAC